MRRSQHDQGARATPPRINYNFTALRSLLAAPCKISTAKCIGPAVPRATCHARGLPSNNLRRWSAHGFSQYGADGIIHKLFADVGTTNKYYVEFGTQSGEECNTRRLRQTCGWTGLLMDGGFNNTRIGQHQHFLTRENIVPLFQRYSVPRSPDLLSVDIDGNDFHVLAAILRHGYRPRVIIVEACFQLPSEVDAVVLYHRAHRWDFSCYHSASVRAYHALAQRYQYSVVHAMAPDLYWVRNDVLTSSVGLDAYDTTNDAEARVKAGSHGFDLESTGCLRVWQTRGYMKSTQAMSSEFISAKRLGKPTKPVLQGKERLASTGL